MNWDRVMNLGIHQVCLWNDGAGTSSDPKQASSGIMGKRKSNLAGYSVLASCDCDCMAFGFILNDNNGSDSVIVRVLRMMVCGNL
mmetsp:Transcript_34168/g.41863  ORF Transcript_34168/g.41863 Transcript_34168/m.41863 type:complete len:85 (+) Transcript_34168:7-261(+)